MAHSFHMGARALSLLDQIFFSAANFILVVLLARFYSDIMVAGYGIGLSIALMIQSTQRTSYVAQNSVLSPGLFRRHARRILGQHLVIWAWVLTLELLLAALLLWLFPGGYSLAIVVSTVICSLIYAQLDFDRIALIKLGRIGDAFIASAGFLMLNIALFIAIPIWGIGYLTTMLLIGLFAVLKIIRLVMLIGEPDYRVGARMAETSLRRYFVSSLLGVVGYTGHSYAPLFILGVVAAPAQSAAFVAMRGLMQPMMVIIRGLDVIDKNLVQAVMAKTPTALRHMLLRQLSIYGALSFVALLCSVWFGEWAIHMAYNSKYDMFGHVLVGWAAIYIMLAITFPIETVIVKLGRLKQYNALRLLAGLIGFVFAVVLCPVFGAIGAVWACIAGWVACVACAGWVVRDVLRGA